MWRLAMRQQVLGNKSLRVLLKVLGRLGEHSIEVHCSTKKLLCGCIISFFNQPVVVDGGGRALVGTTMVSYLPLLAQFFCDGVVERCVVVHVHAARLVILGRYDLFGL